MSSHLQHIHISPDEVSAYLMGAAPDTEAEVIEEHLGVCRRCFELVADTATLAATFDNLETIASALRLVQPLDEVQRQSVTRWRNRLHRRPQICEYVRVSESREARPHGNRVQSSAAAGRIIIREAAEKSESRVRGAVRTRGAARPGPEMDGLTLEVVVAREEGEAEPPRVLLIPSGAPRDTLWQQVEPTTRIARFESVMPGDYTVAVEPPTPEEDHA